ncbi:hypothetical protein Z949_675 [Sulfitobacter guttiformis KCTC 32187]|nr:hypothetical protein Z949_675 [Sulfitobacter guttiformis KCTC 32187]
MIFTLTVGFLVFVTMAFALVILDVLMTCLLLFVTDGKSVQKEWMRKLV